MRGISNECKRRELFDYHRRNADILVMYETHSSIKDEVIWSSEWGGKAIFNHGDTNARGIAIFTTNSYYQQMSNIYKSEDGRCIILDLIEGGIDMCLVAIYAPNEDNPAFFERVRTQLSNRSEHKIILGDFNLALDVGLDRENTYHNNNRALEVVEDIMEEYCLKDTWRIQNPEKREFSWRKAKTFPIKASRIDYALISGGLDQYVKAIEYISSLKTDHRAIYLVLDLTPFERGTGYWKLNNTLLRDAEYVKKVNIEIDRVVMISQSKSPIEQWELLKKRIKQISIEFAKSKVAEDKIVISNLSEKVNEYEATLPLTENENRLYEATKSELEDKMSERIQGVMFRSKAKWYEEGEKSTKYFYSLEKARYNAKTCYQLINERGDIVNNIDEILEEQRHFYSKLYDVDEDVSFNMENTFNVKVPEEIRYNQDVQISLLDLEQAMKRMNNNKTPGEDGIPIDFYKVFWTKLKNIFYSMVLSTYERKMLHTTARQGILNLIPKANKDTRYVKNLRPITLLNVDYKLIEKAIADKMIPALKHIIHPDQRGFMKDRRISVNIRKMLDIMHLAEKEDIEAVIMSLDFVKCFDKCSFQILHGSLKFFDFGNIVQEWTKILYDSFTVKIQNNGRFSKMIDIRKGVHQGGCCSSIYFLVIAEILALSLRSNEKIDGITFKEIRNLLNQFADDMDIFSLCNQKSLEAIREELDWFNKQSGFTVSYDKTTLYRIGSLRHSDAEMYNISEFAWSNKDISVLGVTISHEDIVQKNYNDIIKKARQTLFSWKNRGLSLIGKVQVINTLVASLFVYKMMVLPTIPKNIVRTMDNIFREFLWSGKKAKIAYPILQNPKDQGGLNLVHLTKKDYALKATWPIILKSEPEYSQLVYHMNRLDAIDEDIWRCNLRPEDVDKIGVRDKFWEDVLKGWGMFNCYKNKRIENQILWYNSQIQVRKRPIFWKDVSDKGLKYVHQLFQDRQYKSDQQVMDEFGLTVLRFNSLKSATPTDWKEYFQTYERIQYMPLPPHTYDMCIQGKYPKLSSTIYKFIADDAMIIHYKYIKWRTEIPTGICDTLIDFAKAHVDIYSITNVPKYRSFQYRLLQRGLVTNIQLSKWKITESDQCSFCQQAEESVCHLLYFCPIVQSLWQMIFQFLEREYGVVLRCEIQHIILNSIVQKRNHVANFICLLTKQYIYAQRCLKGQLVFNRLISHIKKVQSIEKYIAIKNDKLSKHMLKWGSPRVNSSDKGFIGNYIEQYISDM